MGNANSHFGTRDSTSCGNSKKRLYSSSADQLCGKAVTSRAQGSTTMNECGAQTSAEPKSKLSIISINLKSIWHSRSSEDCKAPPPEEQHNTGTNKIRFAKQSTACTLLEPRFEPRLSVRRCSEVPPQSPMMEMIPPIIQVDEVSTTGTSSSGRRSISRENSESDSSKLRGSFNDKRRNSSTGQGEAADRLRSASMMAKSRNSSTSSAVSATAGGGGQRIVRQLWNKTLVSKGPIMLGQTISHRMFLKNNNLRDIFKEMSERQSYANVATFQKAHAKAVANMLDKVVKDDTPLSDQNMDELHKVGQLHAQICGDLFEKRFWNDFAAAVFDCTLEWGERGQRTEGTQKAWMVVVTEMMQQLKAGYDYGRRDRVRGKQLHNSASCSDSLSSSARS